MDHHPESTEPSTEKLASTPEATRIQRVPRLRGSEARGESGGLRDERLGELTRLMDHVKALSEQIAGSLPSEPAAPPPKRRDKLPNRPRFGQPVAVTARRAKPKRPLTKRCNPLLIWAVGQTFGFSLVILGFFVGRMDFFGGDGGAPASANNAGNAIENAAKVLAAAPPSREVFQKVNDVMLVGKNGDADTARRLLVDAQRDGLPVPGSDYRLALLALQRGDLREARLRLNCAAAANQQRAASGYINAMLAGAAGDYRLAAQTLEEASYAEPFSARYLFFWGESLRRAGRTEEAVQRLEQALLRPCTPRDAEYIAFKLRLAKIEVGRGDELTGELEEKLQGKSPGAVWLLTAAAREMHRGERDGAKRFLQTAAEGSTPEDFNQQLRDFFFAAQLPRQELTAYLNRSASSAASISAATPKVAAINADPALWTIQAADPGVWPSM